MKVSNAVTFLVVRSFLVSAKLNSLRTAKQTSQGVIDTKLFARVRKVTGKHARAKRVLQDLGDVFGLGNGTTSLDGLSDGLALLLNDTGLGGMAGSLPNGTEAFIGGLQNITNNGTGDLTNELLEVLFGENVTDVVAGLWNSTADNITDIFGDLPGGLGPFGDFNGTETGFFGFTNGTDLFGGMFNDSSGFFGFPNATDIFGGLFNESSGIFGFTNGTDIFGALFNESSGFFGLPNETFILDGIFNGTGNVTDIFAGFFNGTENVTSEILESLFGENVTEIMSGLWNGTSGNGEDIFGGLPEGLGDLFGDFNGTDMMVCPETCAAEVCDIFTSEDDPDLEVLGDACEAGTIKTCAGMYSSLCELVCNGDDSDRANSTFFDFNASEVGDICSMCSFLDCCDGNNAFQTCLALLPAEALPDGVVIAGETGSTLNESATSEVALDEDTAAVDASDNEAADEDSINHGTSASEGTVETNADASREPENSSQALVVSVSRCIFTVFFVVLLIEF